MAENTGESRRSGDTVMVEGTECYLFPIPLDTKDDPIKDARFFLDCAYTRLYHMNQPGQDRSRELSLAITNLEQAFHWFTTHLGHKKFGVDRDPETGLPINNFPSQIAKGGE